jgi:hypothetical protein
MPMTQLGVDELAAEESVVCWCCGQSRPPHWHEKPVIGGVLRWLGRRLP